MLLHGPIAINLLTKSMGGAVGIADILKAGLLPDQFSDEPDGES